LHLDPDRVSVVLVARLRYEMCGGLNLHAPVRERGRQQRADLALVIELADDLNTRPSTLRPQLELGQPRNNHVPASRLDIATRPDRPYLQFWSELLGFDKPARLCALAPATASFRRGRASG
jgi:hypothetical protein